MSHLSYNPALRPDTSVSGGSNSSSRRSRGGGGNGDDDVSDSLRTLKIRDE